LCSWTNLILISPKVSDLKKYFVYGVRVVVFNARFNIFF